MWIKNATVCGFNHKVATALNIQNQKFSPVNSASVESYGWGPVRGDELIHRQGNQYLLQFVHEKKIVPSSAVAVRLAARVAEVTEAQGFVPGKKAIKLLKEEVHDSMLATAFSSRSQTAVWIDGERGRIIIDSASKSACDLILKTLHRTFEDLLAEDVSWPATKVVNEWLIEAPEKITTDDQVTFRYLGGKVVRFVSAALSEWDVQLHLQEGGANVEAMAMTYDDKVSFTMTTDHCLRGIKPLGILTAGMKDIPESDRFDSEFALMTLQMQGLLDAVIAEA